MPTIDEGMAQAAAQLDDIIAEHRRKYVTDIACCETVEDLDAFDELLAAFDKIAVDWRSETLDGLRRALEQSLSDPQS